MERLLEMTHCTYRCLQAVCRAWSHTCLSSFPIWSSVCLTRRPWCVPSPAGHWAATPTGLSASLQILTWSLWWQSCSNVFWIATSVCRRLLAGEQELIKAMYVVFWRIRNLAGHLDLCYPHIFPWVFRHLQISSCCWAHVVSHTLLTVWCFLPLPFLIFPNQCLCHFGGGSVHRAGALPGIYPWHVGVRFQQVPAQKSSHSLRRHRNTCGLSGAPSQ